MAWYVVSEDRSWTGDTVEELAQETIWTVSRQPDECGWQTDGGCHGYGLTKADAQFLADAANRAEGSA